MALLSIKSPLSTLTVGSEPGEPPCAHGEVKCSAFLTHQSSSAAKRPELSVLTCKWLTYREEGRRAQLGEQFEKCFANKISQTAKEHTVKAAQQDQYDVAMKPFNLQIW